MTVRRAALILVCGLAAATLSAQGFRRRQSSMPSVDNVAYDGRFTFARIRYEGYGGMTDEGPGWAHDYPRGERHLMKIMRELTTLQPYMEGGNVLDLKDPDLFKYPVAYMSEPGYWLPTDEDVAALRAYLLKGGFLIFDDFGGQHWYNFEEQMRKVLPAARPIAVDVSHPIFDSFFRIESIEMMSYRGPAQYYAFFEENDPTKRLMVIVNYNNDIGDYWQWSDAGIVPIEISNEAYKLGVNYIVYAMTH